MKFLILVFFCFISLMPPAFAKTIKLGDAISTPTSSTLPSTPTKTRLLMCTENEHCPEQQFCEATRCISVCYGNPCISGKQCIPNKETRHTYKCVECYRNSHCPEGLHCSKNFECQKPDSCAESVCSPGAPFCIGEPYKTLPYTCVQCLTNDHCPPLGGLTRRCEDHYCLFNLPATLPQPTPEITANPNPPSEEFEEVYEEDEQYYEAD